MAPDPRQRLRERLAASRKYRNVADDVLARVVDWSLARHGNAKEAEKAAKRKLHQVYGAFQSGDGVESLAAALNTFPGDTIEQKTILRDILQRHSSTRERAEQLETFFPAIFETTGPPSRILDLGCGLTPLCRPWMGLPENVHYEAVDLDTRAADVLQAFFDHMGYNGRAYAADLMTFRPSERADVVFMLKLLPTLEQQQPGSGIDLLSRLDAPWVVVSFPTHSLGGRAYGTPQGYTTFIDSVTTQTPYIVHATKDFDETVIFLTNT